MLNKIPLSGSIPFLSYAAYGPENGPVVLINHALTGNAYVNEWWGEIVGPSKVIDTTRYRVICFNIPGNGHDGFLLDDSESMTVAEVASHFLYGLDYLQISSVFALVGGSLGGGIGWEMLAQKPDFFENFIPIACDYTTRDWLAGQCQVQKWLLETDMARARYHAMLFYRTPQGLEARFGRRQGEAKGWLEYHGKRLSERFDPKAYALVNHLLTTQNTDVHTLKTSTKIQLIGIDSDQFFAPAFMRQVAGILGVDYHEISSVHGHDAFLIEYPQLIEILKTVF